MLRGLYTAASGMIANQRRHDTITNNIANVNTPGFKAATAVHRAFPEMLIYLTGEGGGTNVQARRIGRLNTGVLAEEAPMRFAQGSLVETGSASDVAIVSNLQVPGVAFNAEGVGITPDGERVYQPQAMFAVRTPDGEEQYTRNGSFTIDAIGQLVTGEGHLVLDAARQPIRVLDPQTGAPKPMSEIRITGSGQLIDAVSGQALLDEGGEPISLFIALIANPHRLVRAGNGNFRLPEGEELPGAVNAEDDFELYQGFIEQSNVDPVRSAVDLMAAQRAYEANQRIVRYYDQSLEKAVNEVGRV